MPYQPTTNFIDSTGVDLGRKFVTKAYLLEVYGRIVELLVPGITPTPALWVWGYNPFGQLALNDTTPNRLTPVTTLIGGNDWKSISLGKDYAVALKTNGTLWTWGVNTFGQLGINSTVSKSTPVTTILGGTNWASVAAGTTHTLAIKTDGTLWLWGENANGQIGVNDTTPNRLTPVTTLLGGTNWRFVAGGGYYTAAIKTDGTLWTWGNNTNGKLAINDLSSGAAKNTPVTTILGGTNWKSVACGLSHGSAIKTDGTLWTWGLNSSGQLGINDFTNRPSPVTTIIGGNNWKSISCHGAGNSVYALKTDGTLWNWGRNLSGQLGVNNFLDKNTPVTTVFGGTNWKSVSSGGSIVNAIKTDGSLWCWGDNSIGQLGVNDISDRNIPVTTILGGNDWKSVSTGDNFTISIRSEDYI